MPETGAALFDEDQRRSWIRLRTLTTLRWVAIAGQAGAIGVADRVFDLRVELGFCAAVIGLSIILNIALHFIYPENKRLDEREAILMLLFDTAQLGLLIILTGGLNNPFAVLIAAPVTVAATALSLRSALLAGAVAVALTSFSADVYLPLLRADGTEMLLPDVFIFGSWVAIVVAIGFIAAYTRRISTETESMSQALLAAQMALAREQKLTDLGGVVAAAAHELGTPLATIKLVSTEMARELESGSDLREDAELIRDQADRCRDILRDMGRAGKDDLHLHQAPFIAVVEEAAEPHRDRGKTVSIDVTKGEAPMIVRQPEVIHGLRNLIQNAVDFAATTVWVELSASDRAMTAKIMDDGPGYPPHLIGRIGDPFIRRRRSSPDRSRPEYEGMGLGLFIAKTLLERTGATLTFTNGTEPYTGRSQPGERSGAIVEVTWPRGNAGIEATERLPALGENLRFSEH
ncbi:sensor histidine kinase RegB [Maritimibacter dapengensis]|uniref:histidine kinase n=1 Tax=Maritimibacter dapengensis TaxID=2836868 RepID=A0ABS6T458_9RHOB|nr:ActS/PrrB/RegB family redox-sensitive histidine kinase [Maritimibacter dapengensis]MBV7380038.1 ActS/PrrB/RegB family redox-sensitive histidine kinase [Maritimibacter dapengensis]